MGSINKRGEGGSLHAAARAELRLAVGAGLDTQKFETVSFGTDEFLRWAEALDDATPLIGLNVLTAAAPPFGRSDRAMQAEQIDYVLNPSTTSARVRRM